MEAVQSLSQTGQPGFSRRYSGRCSSADVDSLWEATLFIAVHLYRDVFLLHFPVQYFAKYSARVDDVLGRMEANEEEYNTDIVQELLIYWPMRRFQALFGVLFVLYL